MTNQLIASYFSIGLFRIVFLFKLITLVLFLVYFNRNPQKQRIRYSSHQKLFGKALSTQTLQCKHLVAELYTLSIQLSPQEHKCKTALSFHKLKL